MIREQPLRPREIKTMSTMKRKEGGSMMMRSCASFHKPGGMTESLELEILEYLEHTGSFACTCSRSWDFVGICCDSQQFHHPEDADLTDDRLNEDEPEHPPDTRTRVKLCDDDEEHDMMGLTAWEKRKFAERDMTWTCCGSHFASTGCQSNDCVTSYEISDALESNEKARARAAACEMWKDDDDDYSSREWDDSFGGDARRSCTCGYVDGVYSYCAC